VRRSLAFSIHELAVIVGQEITERDLVPIYNDFIKDLDEVKIGAVRHIAEFVRVSSYMHTDERCSLLVLRLQLRTSIPRL
jgi:serine/threonine-protein phosphatase 4 regulatory subunit 1